MNIQPESRQAELRTILNLAAEKSELPTEVAVDTHAIYQFCGNPAQYKWEYVEKRDMLLPFNCDASDLLEVDQSIQMKRPDSTLLRWSLHRVLAVEGTLLRGESNILARRRFFIDENSWLILYGEGYDFNGTVVRSYIVYLDEAGMINKRGQWYCWEN